MECLKGTVSRDFRLLFFFMNQFPQAENFPPPRISKKICNGPNGILWGWGETDSWKKSESKNLVTLSLHVSGVPEADVLDDSLHLLHGGDPVAGPVKSHVRKGDRLRKKCKPNDGQQQKAGIIFRKQMKKYKF